MSASLIERVRERLATESAPLLPNVVAAAIRAESSGVLGDTDVLSNLRLLQTELTGAGILEPLLCAEGTTDVLVSAPDSVWVDDGTGLRRSAVRFDDEAAVRRLAQRLALSAGRRLDEAQPWVDGQLTGLSAGGFTVRDANGTIRHLDWDLVADGNHGPEIPCFAAILLVKKLLRDELEMRGAFPCTGFLTLQEFEPEFARWGITTSIRKRAQ